MPTANLQVPRSPQTRAQAKRKRISSERFLPPLILVPSMAAIITFVYNFILITVWVSLSRWGTLRIDWRLRDPWFEAYAQMFAMPRWHAVLSQRCSWARFSCDAEYERSFRNSDCPDSGGCRRVMAVDRLCHVDVYRRTGHRSERTPGSRTDRWSD